MITTLSFKTVTFIVNIVAIPLLISLIGTNEYGYWATISSLINIIMLFDFGLSNGVKNQISKNDLYVKKIDIDSQKIVIGSLQFFYIMCLIFILLYLSLSKTIRILNDNLFVANILFIPFLIYFPLSVGNAVLQGLRKIAIQSYLNLLKPIFWIASLLILSLMKTNFTIEKIAIFYSISNFLFFLLPFLYILKYLNFEELNLLDYKLVVFSLKRIKTGLKFFILQISSMLLFSLGNYLVYHFLSEIEAARFDIINKLYIYTITFFNIVISVYWPEISNKIHNNEIDLLYKLRKQLHKIYALFLISIFSVFIVSPFIFNLLSSNTLSIDYSESIIFMIQVAIQSYCYIGAVFLNAFEKIKGQIILSTLSSLLVIPLSIAFMNYGLGIISIPLTVIILLIPMAFYLNKWSLMELSNLKINGRYS